MVGFLQKNRKTRQMKAMATGLSAWGLLHRALLAGLASGLLLTTGLWASPEGEDSPSDPETVAQTSSLKESIERAKTKLGQVSWGTDVTAFFSVTASNLRNNPDVFSAGDLEFDFQKTFTTNLQAAGAVVFNPQDRWHITVGFLDYHLFGGLIAPRGRIFVEKGFHVQVGRFDVPFGNDWQYFASKDRLTVTAPLSTDLVMDGGYNDYGLRVLGNTRSLNYVFYTLRGWGTGVTYGGRMGFTPFNNPYTLDARKPPRIELGASYLYDANGHGKPDLRAYALDFESHLGPARLQAEYIYKANSTALDGVSPSRLSGFHITQSLDVGKRLGLPTTLYVRYEGFHRDLRSSALLQSGPDAAAALETGNGSRLNRMTGGLQIPLSELFILKLDYLQFLGTARESLENESFGHRSIYAQLVFVF